MATFKVLHYKRVTLLEKHPVGYIFVLLGQDSQIYTLWGGQDSDGFYLTNWGTPKDEFRVSEYEDGFTSTVLISGIPRVCTVTDLSESKLSYSDATLDINFALIGVTPMSIDAGITQTTTGGVGVFTISAEEFKTYTRTKGWCLSATTSLAVTCVDPLFSINFASYALIGNFVEITMAPNTNPAEVDVTAKRVNSRVRWGDAGSALCQEIVAEDDSTNSAGYYDLVETPGQLTAAIPFDDRVVVFKNESIYEMIYSGYPKIFDLSVVVPDNGTVCSNAVKAIGLKSAFFIGNDNFYIYNSGGETKPIGDNIQERFFGPQADFTLTDLMSAQVQVYDDRRELWMWIPTKSGIACSEVYKFKDGAWTMTDYYDYGHGNLACLSKDYYTGASGIKGWVPILFFDELNLTTDDSVDYPGTLNAVMNCYRDLQTGNALNTAEFETKDFPLEIGARVTEFLIQAKSATTPFGLFTLCYSVDEGRNWSTAIQRKVKYSPDLEWYSFTFDVTGESIRFKIACVSALSFGKSIVKFASREREAIE